MKTALADPVEYRLILGDEEVPMNQYIGHKLQLTYEGAINCVYCNRKTNKSYNQGYCYPCFKRLAQCDSCIVSPEKCHYDAGTCREPEWGEANCMIDHYVYLANTSGIKVGITRGTQIPTRWMDQGATQARPIFRVGTRHLSGLVETLFKNHVADKTNWQAMLKGNADPRDLGALREELLGHCESDIAALQDAHGLQAIEVLEDADEVAINYPVLEFPTKVSSLNLDKTPIVGGKLMGIKGQYLMFDTGVINMRKYGGYQVALAVH
ncbi:MAG: DUF2797 domain-containing protein [Pseudomonadota bacterium]